MEISNKNLNIEELQAQVTALESEVGELKQAKRKVVHEFKSFEFKGSGSEYFRIWIVNIALTILTLGIYSAWAKVRANRYMYANTYLNGSNFEYNANPIHILIGRMIVVAIYALFVLFSQYLFMFEIAGGIALLGFLAMPWLVRQAVSFKLRNTSYRNVPFRYEGKVSSFYLFFLLHIFLNIITVMLIFPYSYVKFKQLIIDNAHYGDGDFKFSGGAGDSYAIYIQVFVWSSLFIFAMFIVLGSITAGFALLFENVLPNFKEELNPEIIGTIIAGGVFLVYVPFIFWYKGFADALEPDEESDDIPININDADDILDNNIDTYIFEAEEKKDDKKDGDNKLFNVKKAIKDFIEIKWSTDEEAKGKVVNILKGLIFNDDKMAQKFVKDLDNASNKLSVKDYE